MSDHALWGGRFDDGELAPEMVPLNRSLDVDWRLWRHDLRASRKWAWELRRAGILSGDEITEINNGLDKVEERLAVLAGPWELLDEDIHTAIERLLTEVAGPVGGKLHTGRSRNDQVATAFRMWGMEATRDVRAQIIELVRALAAKAQATRRIVMPGYTHLQQAQPVPVAHWLLSRAWALVRDLRHFQVVTQDCDVMPLGSGAVAGCPFDVDRHMLRIGLGFRGTSHNSIDAVSNRDWAAKLAFAAALAGVHLSQLAEDLVVFSSAEFGFVRIEGGFATGSSLMPQKRNPDVAELVRGKSGRLIGNATAMLAMLKGLPTGYNRDLQEDKQTVFDSVDTLKVALPAMTGTIKNLEIVAERLADAMGAGIHATDLADHLVRRGVPFRESHHAVGQLVRVAEESGRELNELGLDEMREVHPAFGDDAKDVFDPVASTESRSLHGGTSAAALDDQFKVLDAYLKEQVEALEKEWGV